MELANIAFYVTRLLATASSMVFMDSNAGWFGPSWNFLCFIVYLMYKDEPKKMKAMWWLMLVGDLFNLYLWRSTMNIIVLVTTIYFRYHVITFKTGSKPETLLTMPETPSSSAYILDRIHL